MDTDDTSPGDFTVGEHVAAHPATDTFMAGDRYGTVTRLGRRYAHVHMSTSGRTLRFRPTDLLHHDPSTS
jgi:hypothetical protein